MRNSLFAAMLFLASTASAANPPLFPSSTESKWTVTANGKDAGTVTLLTSPNGTRAEFRASAKAPVTVLLGGNGKVWLRTTSGDVELATLSAMTTEYAVAPALLLPFTTGTTDKVESKAGKLVSYAYRGGAKATYRYDDKGVSAVDVNVQGAKYSATRSSIASKTVDASQFAVRPQKSASARLAKLSGSLLGPSDTHVSATAGGRGVSGKGMKLNDGGDYDALLQLESRDEQWAARLDAALEEFQKEGNVGKERNQ